MRLGIMFRNFGPYHLARVGAVSELCMASALEIARYDTETNWDSNKRNCPSMYSVSEQYPQTRRNRYSAVTKIRMWLKENRPDVLAVPGWSEPLALAAALEARRESVPTILMSDSRLLLGGNSGLRSRPVV